MNDQFKTFVFSYEYRGASWVMELKASSPEDAQQRLRQLPWARLDGELVAKVPVAPNWLAKLASAAYSLVRTLTAGQQSR